LTSEILKALDIFQLPEKGALLLKRRKMLSVKRWLGRVALVV
jgi:hypothetical protein